jgi:hypothetical protein
MNVFGSRVLKGGVLFFYVRLGCVNDEIGVLFRVLAIESEHRAILRLGFAHHLSGRRGAARGDSTCNLESFQIYIS